MKFAHFLLPSKLNYLYFRCETQNIQTELTYFSHLNKVQWPRSSITCIDALHTSKEKLAKAYNAPQIEFRQQIQIARILNSHCDKRVILLPVYRMLHPVLFSLTWEIECITKV